MKVPRTSSKAVGPWRMLQLFLRHQAGESMESIGHAERISPTTLARWYEKWSQDLRHVDTEYLARSQLEDICEAAELLAAMRKTLDRAHAVMGRLAAKKQAS